MDEKELSTMKALAESMARTSATEIGASLREDMRKSFTDLEDRLTKHIDTEMDRRFGAIDPAQHVIQHDRLERMLKWVESMQGTFWKAVMGMLIKVAFFFILAYGAYKGYFA